MTGKESSEGNIALSTLHTLEQCVNSDWFIVDESSIWKRARSSGEPPPGELITDAFQSGLAPLGAGMNWMNFGHKDIAEVYEVLDLIDLTPRRPSSPRSPASPIPWLVRNKCSCSTVCRLQISPILGTL